MRCTPPLSGGNRLRICFQRDLAVSCHREDVPDGRDRSLDQLGRARGSAFRLRSRSSPPVRAPRPWRNSRSRAGVQSHSVRPSPRRKRLSRSDSSCSGSCRKGYGRIFRGSCQGRPGQPCRAKTELPEGGDAAGAGISRQPRPVLCGFPAPHRRPSALRLGGEERFRGDELDPRRCISARALRSRRREKGRRRHPSQAPS